MSHAHTADPSPSTASHEGCCQGTGACKTEGGAKKEGCCKENGQKSSGCCGGSSQSDRARSDNAELASNMLRPMTAQELATLPTLHLVMRSRRGVQALDNRVLQLTERQIDQAFLPEANVGRWPIRVLLGHLADAELAFAHRMRRTVGEDHPVVALWDEDSFVDANIYDNADKVYADDPEADRARVMAAVGGHMAVIHTLRQWAGQWLLSLDDAAWQRTMMHPQRGEVSLKMQLAMNTWHLEHHAKFLTLKLDRMGIEHPVQQKQGCGSGCGCH